MRHLSRREFLTYGVGSLGAVAVAGTRGSSLTALSRPSPIGCVGKIQLRRVELRRHLRYKGVPANGGRLQ